MKVQFGFFNRKPNKPNVIETLFDTRAYEMGEIVYNKEKKKYQIILSMIPNDKKDRFGIPKLKRAYNCVNKDTMVWSIELGENLRTATVFE